MKNLILLMLCFVMASPLMSQNLSKSEKKALKKEIKSLKKDPIQYRYLKENTGIKDLVINEQIYEIAALKKEANVRQQQLEEATNKIASLQDNVKADDSNCGINAAGKNYRVQIGLFKYLDLTTYLDALKFLEYERVGDLYRYSIGNFKTEAEAEAFKLEMRKMGIKDAFVSEYTDGKRDK